jgi:hypothetical protein
VSQFDVSIGYRDLGVKVLRLAFERTRMTREELADASEELRQAAEVVTGETRERLYDQADAFADAAAADHGPDHGKLARHLHILREIEADVGEEAAAHVETARDLVSTYREGVEGV